MSSSPEPPTKNSLNDDTKNEKAKPSEILLQVKALQDIRRTLRTNTFKMKKSSSLPAGSGDVEKLKGECQREEKDGMWIRKEDTAKVYFTKFMAELIGTGFLMFLGCLGCAPQADDPPAFHQFGGISFGLSVCLIIQIFGHVSMAHLNPAVTICAVMLGLISPIMGLVYFVAQMIGATLGFALLKILMPKSWVVPGFCMTKLYPETTVMQALGIEFIVTAALVFVCCGVWDKRNQDKLDSVPLRFGFIVALLAMNAGPLTGCSMNTARSFAPAILEMDFEDHWIYWVGPNLAAVLATGIYMVLFSYKEPKSDNDERTRIVDGKA